MSRRVADLVNALPVPVARAELGGCCGAPSWVERMIAARPFGDDAALFEAAERIWWTLSPREWLESFARHPRIGEAATDSRAREEQAGALAAAGTTRQALAAGNRTYEAKFGHVFLICATGLTADAMLGALERRLANDPARELQIAAAEQAKITKLRLAKLASP